MAEWLVAVGPLVTTGDMYALKYFQLMLISVYGSNSIVHHEARELKKELDKGNENNVINGDMILVGGPSSNNMTEMLLKKLGALSLFPNYENDDFIIRKWGSEHNFLEPILRSDSRGYVTDCGVILKGKNPWNENFNFLAAMGSCSWGTQAAAAAICSEDGMVNIIQTEIAVDDPMIENRDWLEALGYVEVRPGNIERIGQEGLPALLVPECEIRRAWPDEGPWDKNPEKVLNSGQELRKAAAYGEVAPVMVSLGFIPSYFIMSIVLLCLSAVFFTLGFLRTNNLAESIFVAAVLGVCGILLLIRNFKPQN